MPRISKWSRERSPSWRSWISRLRNSAAARRVASDAAGSVLGAGGGEDVAGAAAAGAAAAGALAVTTDGDGPGPAAAGPEPRAPRAPVRGELRAARCPDSHEPR